MHTCSCPKSNDKCFSGTISAVDSELVDAQARKDDMQEMHDKLQDYSTSLQGFNSKLQVTTLSVIDTTFLD